MSQAVKQQMGERLSEDLLSETTEDIMTSASNVAERGLQQFYTPSKFAEFIAEIMLRDGREFSVCDLTAGDGALLLPFNRAGVQCHGVEIDAVKCDKSLGVVRGDLCRVAPYLEELNVKFSKFVLNPPFGLRWSYEGREWNSAELTLRLANDLSQGYGEGVMIMHEANWSGVRAAEEELPGVHFYAAFKVAGLFAPASSVRCVVAFWRGSWADVERSGGDLTGEESPAFDWSKFDEWEAEAFEFITERRGRYFAQSAPNSDEWTSQRMRAAASAARAEVESKVQRFNFEVHGSSVRVHVPDITALRLIKARGESYLLKVRKFSGLPFRYFAMNTEAANFIREAVESGLLTAEPGRLEFARPELHEGGYWFPGLLERVERAVRESAKYISPFYQLKELQRLGYLWDLKQIRCKESDAEAGYVAGEFYPIKSRTVDWVRTEYIMKPRRQGDEVFEESVEVKVEGKSLRITIGGREFTESADDKRYIVQVFDVPEPGDITQHFASDYRRYYAELSKLETPRFKFREFQKDDLARLCCRPGAVLAWEQGLGKMIGGLAYAIVRGGRRVLIVAPGDLIPQWVAEARDKFGVSLHRIETVEQARLLSKRKRSALPEFYIVHYEALSRKGTLPVKEWKRAPGREGENRDEVRWLVALEKTVDSLGRPVSKVKYHSSKSHCPHCRHKFAYNGSYCDPKKTMRHEGETIRGCGYVHYARRIHSMAHYLKKAFSCVIVDEGTKIKGESLMGQAVRSLRPRSRLVLTGTPVKNFLHDSFYLLLWANGMRPSEAFPYGYSDKMKFLEDYCTIEREMPSRRTKGRMGDKKVRPEISNVNMLWRCLAPSILRRRKSETGEDLVKKRLVPVRVPWSVNQQAVYAWWLHNFGEWFAGRDDLEKKLSPQLAQALAGCLGLLWKLRQVASVPAMFELERHNGRRSPSNATPKLITCLELVRDALEAGEPVVVFSSIRAASQLIKAELDRGGVKSRICDGETKQSERSAAVADFKAGRFQVLIAGIEAMNLGHNLENAKRAIVYSLPFDLGSFDQAINRIHRLTSSQDVLIHILLVAGASIDGKMWNLIERKGASAGLAIDGELGFDDVEEVDWNQVAKELREEFESTAAITESQVAAKLEHLWDGLKLIERDGDQVRAAAGLIDEIEIDLGELELLL